MSLDRHGPSSLTKTRDTTSTARDGTTVTLTRTETWSGPYADLVAKRDSVWTAAKSTSLVPDDAGSGILTLGYETKTEWEVEDVPAVEPPQPVYEVISQEIRQPIEHNEHFAALTAEDRDLVEAALQGDKAPPTVAGLAKDLYDLKSVGTTEYAFGVPVVRSTETELLAAPAAETIWVRDNPPAAAPGPAGWVWMRTAYEVRKEGGTYSRTREWTGAKVWSPILYPIVP